MAMEYARLYFDFFGHEKTLNLIDVCDLEGVFGLQKLWIRAGLRNNDGLFKKSVRALEKIAGWKGESGLLIKTLTDKDFPFMEKVAENEYILHNWEFLNPHLTEKAKEMRSKRASKAGLASADKKKRISTISQQQDNSKLAHSQLNSTQPQLNSTNVTKRNLIKEKMNKKKGEVTVPWLVEKNGRLSVIIKNLPFPIYLNKIYHKDLAGFKESFDHEPKEIKAQIFKHIKACTNIACQSCGNPFINEGNPSCVSCRER
jgi:hypothetical protein